MKIELIPLEETHVWEIVRRNIEDGMNHGLQVHKSLNIADVVKAYLSPGSLAVTGLLDGTIVGCGGIINLGWNRGEAWLLPTSLFFKHVKSCYRVLCGAFVDMVKQGNFIRVQAVTDRPELDAWYKHLGFEDEGMLRAFGPEHQTVKMRSRIF